MKLYGSHKVAVGLLYFIVSIYLTVKVWTETLSQSMLNDEGSFNLSHENKSEIFAWMPLEKPSINADCRELNESVDL